MMVTLNDHDSDLDGFDNNVNSEDDKSTVGAVERVERIGHHQHLALVC